MARRARVHERAGSNNTALRVITRARRLLEQLDAPGTAEATARLDNLMSVVRLAQDRAGRSPLGSARG